MSTSRQNEKDYYWVVREWFNETMQKMSKQSRGYPAYYFRHSEKMFMNDPEYTEIWKGTRKHITSLAGLRDYYYGEEHREWKESEKQRLYSEMERIK